MRPEQIEAARNYLDALERDNEEPLPDHGVERTRRLDRRLDWGHHIIHIAEEANQETWRMDQVARGEQYGA